MKNIIIYTDIGDDIDDMLAIRFANKTSFVESLIIILHHYEKEKRQEARRAIQPYMHIPYTVIYGRDDDCAKQVARAIDDEKKYDILAIGPLTECTHHIKMRAIPHKNIASITIQGVAHPTHDGWIVDESSWNIKTDMQSALFFSTPFLQYAIPLYWVGKYAAYEVGLTKDRFHKQKLAEGTPQSNTYSFAYQLEKHAYKRHRIFHHINQKKHKEIYGNTPDILSFPYDLIGMISILYPDMFFREKYRGYSIIGHTQGKRVSDHIHTLIAPKIS